MNRFKGDRITNGSTPDRSNIKLKDKLNPEPQFDELIIPNWTYSTDLGLVCNPIREKRMKVIKRSVQKKTKQFESSFHSTTKLIHSSPVIILR